MYYKKKQSRTIAIAGKECMEKMVGSARNVHQQQLSPIFSQLKSFVNNPPAIVSSTPNEFLDTGAGSSSRGESSQSPYSVSILKKIARHLHQITTSFKEFRIYVSLIKVLKVLLI